MNSCVNIKRAIHIVNHSLPASIWLFIFKASSLLSFFLLPINESIINTHERVFSLTSVL